MGDGSKLGSRMFNRSLKGDVESVNLVRECRELEEVLGTQYTDMILKAEGGGPHPCDLKKGGYAKRQGTEAGQMFPGRQSSSGGTHSLDYWMGGAVDIAALDEGPRCIQQMKYLVKTLCHCCFGGTKQDCPCVPKEVTQEMIDSLAIMDFKFLKTF